ncbi:strictosidine synthase family protein [Medicago truncatula]|uniref:Strictosidine synthase family protein n=2 Tax=Medicago truncatula TaxID=3880 RepID=G7KRP1_MEDTR|nr:strictosidine synthase family protein [Medicago truncatula]
MRPQLHLTAAVVAVFMTAWLAYSRGVTPSKDVTKTSTFGVFNVWQYENKLPIEYGAVGPESFAFDPHGEGPYTGVSDGHIIKWHHHQNRWEDFAVTSSPHRGDDDDVEECGGPYKEHPKKEHICGRPLGLCFNVASGQLYVADAYMGLVVIEPTGGIARKVISHAVEGQPLAFTNSLDIDQRTGAVYFTSSSSKYERRDYVSLILTGDNSGRLIKYEPKSEQVNVLLNNLTFANGVALSKNGNYILISETTKCRILRYWLETPKAGTLEVFANLPGFPDNIKRSPRGGFWVGINSRREKLIQWMISYPWIGKGLVMLPLDITKTYSYLSKKKGSPGLAIRLSEEGDVLEIVEDHRSGNRSSITEVEERDGVLWVGSLDAPFVIKYNNSCGASIK